MRVSCTAWVAPFDLGVSQQVAIEATPTDLQDVFDLRVSIHRLSGDMPACRQTGAAGTA